MTIEQLDKKLRQNIKNGRLVISGESIGEELASRFLSNVMSSATLTFEAAEVTLAANKLTITGATDFLPALVMNTELILAKGNGALEASLHATPADSAKLEFPGIPWFAVEDVAVAVQTPGSKNVALGSLSGVIRLSSFNLPVALRLPAGLGGWRIAASLENVPLPNFSDIAELIGDSEIVDFFPAQLNNALKGLRIRDFAVEFNPDTKSITLISVTITSTAQWQIFPRKLAIQDLALHFDIVQPGNERQRVVSGFVSGSIKIGRQEIPVEIHRARGLEEWGLVIGAGSGIPLPGISEIVALAGGDDFKRSLPAGMDNLGNVLLSRGEIWFSPSENAFSTMRLGLSSSSSWSIPGFTRLKIERPACEFQLARRAKNAPLQISGSIAALFKVGGVAMQISALKSADTGAWRLQGKLAPGEIVNLSAIVEKFLESISLPAELPDLKFADVEISVTPNTGEFSLQAKSMESWQLPVGNNGITLGDLHLRIARSSEGAQKKTTGFIGGKLNLGSVSFAVQYAFPGEFILTGDLPKINLSALLQELVGGDLLRDIPVPANVLAAVLTGLRFTIAPKSHYVSIAATSDLGQVEINMKKAGAKWGFSVAFAPPANWKFSALAPELAVLDGLKFSNSAMVIASADDRALVIKSITAPVRVTKGFNFVANIDLTGLGADQVLNIKALQVYAAIGGNPANVVLEAAIAGSIRIDQNTAFGDLRLRIVPAPQNFSLTLLGTVFAQIGESRLLFTGGMQVQPRSALFQATMLGDWKEPFGAKGVVVSNVAIELGMSFPPPLPSVGFAGTLQVGQFKGMVAVKFDSAMPSRSMLAIAFNRLYLMDVIKQFCGPQIASGIPKALQSTVLDIGFEDVNFYIVPQPTRIGELTFEQGFTIQGRMRFWGLYAYAYVNLDYTNGVLIKGDVDSIEIAGIFKLMGARGRAHASLYIDLRRGNTPTIDIQGMVQLLGLSSETVIKISDKGFYFFTQGRIYNLFEATIEAQGSDLKKGGDFMLAVTMRQDLFEYLREKASAAIAASTKDAVRKLSDAQHDLDRAQAEVNRLLGEIENMRKVIRGERARDQRRLQAAQAEVQRQQNEVNRLDGLIAAMRQTIVNERARDTARLRAAQHEVQNKQNEVNRLQNEINAAKKRIAQLKRAIKAKENWYDNLPWYEKLNPAKWGEVVRDNTPRAAEISGLGIKIGGLEAAKHAAWGALELAKAFLRGLEAGAKTFPVEADPRMAGLITARGTAWAALEAARGVLRGIEQVTQTFPIDSDPRVVGLFAAYGTATGGLQAAKSFLEGTKLAVGGLAQVGQFIVDAGLGGLIDIKSASFRASLAAANGGRVAMRLELVFMKKDRRQLLLDFSFHDPLSAASSLAKALLPA